MNPKDINTILKEFESMDNISPSENWDLVFDEKLNNARKSKSNKISKINIAILVLFFINVGFIWNSIRTETSNTEVSRSSDLKVIFDELLISKN